MSANQINTWLNTNFGSGSCISTSHGFSAPDPTGYSPSGGFTYGSDTSAGQIIYDAAQVYGINPQVLLTTLEKEQSLVAGGAGCSTLRYTAAAGYGCPDGGNSYSYSGIDLYSTGTTFNSDYSISHAGSQVTSVSGTCVNTALKDGFSQQIIRAAWLLKFGEQRSEGNINWAVIKGSWNNSDDPQSCYGGPMTQGTWQICPSGATTFYDGYMTIDGTSVHMDDGATAALYWYTPHFPGNQSFFNIFSGWFGPTVNNSLSFAVIQGPNSPAVYLQTSAGKYYLPSGAIMQAWGLGSLPIEQVSQGYLDSLPTHGWVGNLLQDDWGNLFLVDNGTLHYIRDRSYLALWNIDPSSAVQSLGIAYTLPSATWVGRFVQDASQPTGQIWLLDKGQKRPVSNTNMLYEWRYTPDQLTSLSSAFWASMPTGAAVTQYASNGTTNYLIDSGQKLSFPNNDTQNDYYGAQVASLYDSSTLSYLPTTSAWQFVMNSANGQWFMLEGGNKHYISTGNLAAVWGKTADKSLTSVSPGFLGSLPDGGNLSYVVQTGSPATYWLIDGVKHYIPNSTISQAWLQPNTTPPVYSSQSLDQLAQGPDATTSINGIGSPYTYTMDSGIKHYLTTASARSAWGGTVLSVSNQLVASIPEGQFVNYLVKNGAGQAYLLMNSVAYPINPAYYDVWGVTSTTPVVTDQTFSRYPTAGTLQAFITIGSVSYIMSGGGSKIPVTTYSDAYLLPSLGSVALPIDYFSSTPQASYLVKSTDPSNTQVWLMTGGEKMSLTFEQQVSYGYLSRGVQPTPLSPATLNLIPNDVRQPSLLIQKQTSGIKLLSFGHALGFPDGATLTSYIGSSNQILQVPASVFNSFSLTGNTSRLIEDDHGNYYWMDSGTKHHILTWSILTRYLATPVTYLEGTSMYLLPNGTEINN